MKRSMKLWKGCEHEYSWMVNAGDFVGQLSELLVVPMATSAKSCRDVNPFRLPRNVNFWRDLFLQLQRFVSKLVIYLVVAFYGAWSLGVSWGVAQVVENPNEDQNPTWVVRNWNAADGLLQESVPAITATDDGYVWLGTRSSLSRFDGVTFKHFGLADGLPGLGFTVMAADDADGLWIGTAGSGLVHWTNTGITKITTQDGLSGEDIYSLVSPSPNSLWIGTSQGLQHWTPRGLRQIQLVPEDKKNNVNSNVIIRAIAMGPNSEVWCSAYTLGLFRIDEDHCERIMFPEKYSNSEAITLWVDRHGVLWAPIGNGIVLRRSGETWTELGVRDGVPFNLIERMAESGDGTIWLGTDFAGLYACRDGRIEKVPGVGTSIRSFCVDSNDVLWVGTESQGLYRVTRSRVGAFAVGVGSKVGVVKGLAEDADGEIWAATQGGSLHHGPLTNLKPVENIPAVGEYPSVRAGLRDQQGFMWFVCPEFVVGRNSGGSEAEIFPTSQANLTSIIQRSDGLIFVGGRDGALRRFEGTGFSIVPDTPFDSPITSIANHSDGYLWIGTFGNGIFRWREDGIKHYSTKEGLPVNTVNSILVGADGTCWIGTNGAGLSWINPAGTIRTFDDRHGLPSTVVCALIENGEDELWLGTAHGIVRLLKSELSRWADDASLAPSVFKLGTDDGMPSAECSAGYSPAGLRTKNGLLLFSTPRHIIAVNPADFSYRPDTPEVRIESMKVGEATHQSSFPTIIKPGVTPIQFEFTALKGARPQGTRFQYRLLGVSDDWRAVGPRRQIQFDGLPPGDYRFEISACNSLGLWGLPSATANFRVEAFYWQTKWFQFSVLSLLMVMVAAVSATLARNRTLLRQEKMESLKEREKANVYQSQAAHLARVATLEKLSNSFAHELSQPLSAILTNAESARRILQRDPINRVEVTEALNDIVADDQRASEIVEHMRDLLRKRPRTNAPMDYQEVIGKAVQAVAPELKSQSIALKYEREPTTAYGLGDQVQLEQVLINLILNAAQAINESHSEERAVTVSSKLLESELLISVSDTGPGIAKDMEERIFEPFYSTREDGLGIGLSLCRAIAQSHGGRIWAQSNPSGGALFSIAIPLVGEGRDE